MRTAADLLHAIRNASAGAYYVGLERNVVADIEAKLLQIGTLYDAIKHGDEKHRSWLKQAIDNHFAGLPMPE